MLSVEQARDRILDRIRPPAPIELPLAEAHGCVLAADVVAEFDVPPFSACEVEGFAVRAADVHAAEGEAPAGLRLVGEATPGRPPEVTVGWGEAVRVGAGSPLPAGADAVAPMETCGIEGDTVAVYAPVDEGAFVRPAGLDARAGQVLVPAGRRLTSIELGTLAAVGHAAPLAYPSVRVSVMTLGGDLIEPGRPAAFGQARDAASFAMLGALRDTGAVPYRIGIVPDDEHEIHEAILTNLSRADLFICVGGPGDDALEPRRLAALGEVEVESVAMYPGTEHGFGEIEGTPFFALPGTPASLFVAFEVLVRPAILRSMGRRDLGRPEVTAVLDDEVDGPEGLTLFAPVRVAQVDGEWHATPTGPTDPRLFMPTARANGLAVVPAGEKAISGDRVRVRVFRALER